MLSVQLFFFLCPGYIVLFFFSIYILFQWTHSLLEDPCIHLYFSSKKQRKLWILYKSAVGFDFWDVWGRRQGGRMAGWSVHHSMRRCVVEVGAWFCSAGPLITLHCMSPIVIVTKFFYYVLCPKMSSSWIWKFRKESVRNEAIKSWLWSKNLCLFNHMLMNDLDLIYDNEEKKRNTALNLIDDCIFIVEIHALICCTLYYFVWQILPKKKWSKLWINISELLYKYRTIFGYFLSLWLIIIFLWN